jgi:hypothetical protein
MDRNAALAAALGAAVLAGCTADREAAPAPTTPSATTPPPADPDLALLSGWYAAERRLAARYAVLVRRVPALAPLRANHDTRADAVRDHLLVRGASPAEQPGAPLRGAPRSLVKSFAAAERRLAAAYLSELARVTDPKVATLGAELAAGARQHATLLELVPVPAT